MDDVSSVEDHLMVYNRKSLYYVMIGLLLSVYRRFKRDIAHAKQIQKKRKTRKETVSEEDSPVFMRCFRHQYSTFKKASPKTCLLTLFFERYLNR